MTQINEELLLQYKQQLVAVQEEINRAIQEQQYYKQQLDSLILKQKSIANEQKERKEKQSKKLKALEKEIEQKKKLLQELLDRAKNCSNIDSLEAYNNRPFPAVEKQGIKQEMSTSSKSETQIKRVMEDTDEIPSWVLEQSINSANNSTRLRTCPFCENMYYDDNFLYEHLLTEHAKEFSEMERKPGWFDTLKNSFRKFIG